MKILWVSEGGVDITPTLSERWVSTMDSRIPDVSYIKMVDYQSIKEDLNFLIHIAVLAIRPDKPVHKGLDPTFYHTLTYEGDVELVNKLNNVINNLTEGNLNE
jgi:hypothetical protein